MGRKKTRVVVAQSTISAEQQMDFWRKVSDGTIDGPRFQAFLEAPDRFAPVTTTLTRAVKILGAGQIVTAEAAAKAWDVPAPSTAVIRYSEQALREAAAENAKREADWRLVYILGLWSLRELREKLGIDPKSQPCVYNNNWWLAKSEDSWATRKPVAGYVLIDFKGRWGSATWANQEMLIAASGPAMERTDEVALTEACLTIYKVSEVYLLSGWYHWGRSETSDGDRVDVGVFGRRGWGVGRDRPGCGGSDGLRVCRARKFS